MTSPVLSVVLPTYNRAAGVAQAIQTVVDQTASPDLYEVIVVDNNSTDNTSEVVRAMAAKHPSLIRYVFETRQGVSYARQAGIDVARGELIGFFDDDVKVAPDWIETILRTFAEHPELDCIGGKVLPKFQVPPPAWLTPSHWAPLALQDFGNEPLEISAKTLRGLISANLACRKGLLDRIGGFSPRFQRVKDIIGSLEDDEWNRRMWKAGAKASYVPELVATTDVPADRLTRAYHRRWHRGHGAFYAIMRAEEIERSSRGYLLGVPLHLYRSAVSDVIGFCSAVVARRPDKAFLHEVKLRFFRGFVAQRFVERRYS